LGGIEERVEGLEAGDDYLFKAVCLLPSSFGAPSMPLARRAPQWRQGPNRSQGSRTLEMDLISRKVRRAEPGDRPSSRREFPLLELPDAKGQRRSSW